MRILNSSFSILSSFLFLPHSFLPDVFRGNLCGQLYVAFSIMCDKVKCMFDYDNLINICGWFKLLTPYWCVTDEMI